MVSLYLVRHAVAEERGPKFPDDTVRPLTRDGRARMKAVVAGWRSLDPALDVILTSPLVRARSTAEIIRHGLKDDVRIEECKALEPEHAPEDVAIALGKLKAAAAIALVGHEPGLGRLAAWLLGADEPIAFKKGGIARIDVAALPPKQKGSLVWHAWPKMLRGLR